MEIKKMLYLFVPSIVILLLTTVACNNDEPDKGNKNTIEGVWYYENIYRDMAFYHLYDFHADGSVLYYDKYSTGTNQRYDKYEGTYKVINDSLFITFETFEQERKIAFSDEGQKMKLLPSDFTYYRSTTMKNLDDIIYGQSYIDKNEESGSDTSTEPPYENYIHCQFGHYGYTELTKVEMQCEHGKGTDANFKYLRFMGSNGSFYPNGAMIHYSTPYYEGIDKYWADGTYKVNTGSGYWTYVFKLQLDGKFITRDEEGTLTIKTNGKIKTLDYKSEYVTIHFMGVVSN